MRDLGLPDVFDRVDLGDWVAVTLDEARDQGRVAPPAVMLVYSRLDAPCYDEIAERAAAISAPDPSAGLVSRRSMTAAHQRSLRTRGSPELESIRTEQDLLGHRPIELPTTDGRMQYVITDKTVTFRVADSPVEWRYALSYPPAAIALHAGPDDARPPLSWNVQEETTGLWWLPYPSLVDRGRLDRWQEQSDLVRLVEHGCLPLFVSHRWLATQEPDPAGRQARLLAWQLLSVLCEALHIAAARGLHEAKQTSALIGCRVGIGGSDLAEAMIVALLRPGLDDDLLEAAVAEARSIEDRFDVDLVHRADDDVDLRQLRDALDRCPILTALAARIRLWIDYCCLPQPPYSDQEREEFVAGLRLLSATQMLGRTLVLLDDVVGYTERAWCLLEALTADRMMGEFDVVAGHPDNVDRYGLPNTALSDLLSDLPHVLWRAMLDAEVLGRCSWEEAMARMELSVTEAADLPYIYDRLRSTPGPNRVHTVAGDIVTGMMPLYQADNGALVLPDGSEKRIDGSEPTDRGTIDCNVLTLADRGAVGATPDGSSLAPVESWDPTGMGDPLAHVVVVGSCEGEAVLISDWVEQHVGELEQRFDVDIVSRSWIADDVAPVGAFVFGGLAVIPVRAPNWIVVALDVRRAHCTVTRTIANAALQAGLGLASVSIDGGQLKTEGEFPVSHANPGPDARRRHPHSNALDTSLGGVYRTDFIDFLETLGRPEESDDDR